MNEVASQLFEAYEEYSKTVRTWLVAYGIGAPVLFLTNEALARTLWKSGQAPRVAFFFLAGVVLQVGLAMLNKNVMWMCYYAEENDKFKAKKAVHFADWLSRQYWIDVVVDFGTLTLFASATWRAFEILTSVKP
jgi:hypothetical protein